MTDRLTFITDTLRLTEFLTTLHRELHLIIADVHLDYVPSNVHLSSYQNHKELLNTLGRSKCVSISLDSCPKPAPTRRCLLDLKSVLTSSKKMTAVQLFDSGTNPLLHHEAMPADLTAMLQETSTDVAWEALVELHVNVMLLLPIGTQGLGQSFWQQQGLWSTLKRLSVEGPALSFGLFFRHAGSLAALVSLKLRFAGAPRRKLTQVPETLEFPFQRLEKLREIELS